ncbi:MAG: class I adenylate-forming enzyme family protein [Leptospiraceae bacterium]
MSAAALWMGVRLWLQRWQREDPVVFAAIGAGPEYLEVLVATLVRGGTFVAGHPEQGFEHLRTEILQWQPDFVVLDRHSSFTIPGYRICDEVNEHRNALLLGRIHGYEDLQEKHPLRQFHSSERRIILSTSGTTGGQRKWAILSDYNLFSVLRTHLPRLQMKGATVLSVLPWNHAFGLILDLIPALLRARTIVRDIPGDASRFLAVQKRFGIDYVSAVPAVFDRWLKDDSVKDVIGSFTGGLLGGASVNSQLANALRGSSFRVGYGQTEASPGITLGNAGDFKQGFIGNVLGCEVDISQGTLHYRGPNVCTAMVNFTESPGIQFSESTRVALEDAMHSLTIGIQKRDSGNWQDTGDIVQEVEGGFRYLGRANDNFKLSNGRFLDAIAWEKALEESTGYHCYIVSFDGGFKVYFAAPDHESGKQSFPTIKLQARQSLGKLGEYIRGMEFLQARDIPRSSKGDVNRSALSNPKAGGS